MGGTGEMDFLKVSVVCKVGMNLMLFARPLLFHDNETNSCRNKLVDIPCRTLKNPD